MAFEQPDSANGGEAALALAAQEPYEVIFLDVQMPDMGGFTLCSKIRQTAPNRATPVVFVTSQDDADAHVRALQSGGSDFLAKPFLLIELTVKALTFALRGRLQNLPKTAPGHEAATPPSVLSQGNETGISLQPEGSFEQAQAGSAALKEPVQKMKMEPEDPSKPEATRDLILLSGPTEQPSATAVESPASDRSTVRKANSVGVNFEVSRDNFTRVPEYLAGLRKILQQLTPTHDQEARREMLTDLYLRVQLLTHKAGRAELRTVSHVSQVLEGLLKRLVEKPEDATPSTLRTVASAFDLLKDLFVPGLKADLATDPVIRLLVVDDEPLARRALTGALQIAFEKPDSAANGEAALALAEQKPYEVIFLDVQMPGLDGFTLCTKVHETTPNRCTPVVFVTSQADFEARAKSIQSGGSDFIAKPFLPVEITVKALTFALRKRLQTLQPPTPPQAVVSSADEKELAIS